MVQVQHGSATTTAAVRRAIQHSQASLRALAKRYGINQKTVAKWKRRTSVADLPTGPQQPKSTVLSGEDEAVIVAFRRHTLLPLDDCLYALQPTIPHLTRSSLHRCLQRHGISRLPDVKGDKPQRAKFKRYPLGYFHIDIAEVHTEQGRLYLLVAIDRTSKFAFVELHEKATRRVAGNFLRALAAAVPYKIHTVLTDNGTHFTDPSGEAWTPAEIKQMRAEKVLFRCHSFEGACADLDIEHRLTKPRHPWTNGQVERMNRTIKDATVRRFHYDSHDQLRQHLADFVAAYNFARRLKTLRGLTPYEAICKAWTDEPERFKQNPHHQIPGPNTAPKLLKARIMADSDNSTAMPIVTRRETLALGMRAASIGSARPPVRGQAASSNTQYPSATFNDPVVALWRDWTRDADAQDWAVEDRADLAFEALVQTPSSSVAGIAAKLDAVLSEGEVWENVSQFPWPHVRPALDDLMRLFGEAMPADLVEVHRLRQSGVMRRPQRREGFGLHIPRDFPTKEENG